VGAGVSLRPSKKVVEGERVKDEARGERVEEEGEALNSGEGARSCRVGGVVVTSAIGARTVTERRRKGVRRRGEDG
jgi:hypothetical protein